MQAFSEARTLAVGPRAFLQASLEAGIIGGTGGMEASF
jgi:hypothetical protein